MAEEEVLTEEKVEVEKETPAEETPVEEKSLLEQREEEIRQQEEAALKEEEEAEDTEIEDLDWNKLKEDHPEIEKLGIKDMAELVKRYFGGLPDFQKNAEIVKELKKLGFETPSEREELFKKLGSKEEIKPSEKGKETTEKSFVEQRRENLGKFVHQYVTDQDTGEFREATDEEKTAQHDNLENLANAIVDPELSGTVSRVEVETTNLRDDLAWTLFQLQPILEKHKEDLIPDSVRTEIMEHSKKFPKTYAEIVQDALKRGVNFYGPVHHHFLTHTKKDLIETEQKKRWEEERDKEDKKKKDAKTETVKKAMPSGASKSWKDMSLQEKEQHIRDQEKAG